MNESEGWAGGDGLVVPEVVRGGSFDAGSLTGTFLTVQGARGTNSLRVGVVSFGTR